MLRGAKGNCAVALIVNVDEFAELCGVTTETMRVHLKVLQPDPMWLLERGAQGRPYKIDVDGGVAWWKAKRDDDDRLSAERQAQLAQLRFEHLGEAADSEEALSLSGKQRREEYAAVLERIKLRRIMGELVERAELEALLTHAAVECRQRLMLVPGEYAATMGLAPDEVRPLEGLIERAVGEFVAAIAVATAGPASA